MNRLVGVHRKRLFVSSILTLPRSGAIFGTRYPAGIYKKCTRFVPFGANTESNVFPLKQRTAKFPSTLTSSRVGRANDWPIPLARHTFLRHSSRLKIFRERRTSRVAEQKSSVVSSWRRDAVKNKTEEAEARGVERREKIWNFFPHPRVSPWKSSLPSVPIFFFHPVPSSTLSKLE